MSQPNLTPLDVYKILPQTNCGKCILPSCLAFAAGVVAGRQKLRDCPELDPAVIALILHPLPKIPILICYQAPEDDLESQLTIFFDECCVTNLHIKSIFTLCSGLVRMFAKIAEHHLER